ncbi:MAG: ABC transporter ATP-binding protein [Rhodospirillales bacterium]
MIELTQVGHRFADTDAPILAEIDLTLSERRIAVIGANGSGKSTFARLLNGLIVPSDGSVRVDGLDTRTDGKAVRRLVGFVFQNPDHQIVLPTVEEDLTFGLRNLKLPAAEITARSEAALEHYDLARLRHRSAHLLSGGEKQLLAIAAVVVMEPRYIVFDEPTTLLDLRNARRIGRVIAELAQTAIVITHDFSLIEGFDRVLVFDRGRLVADDAPGTAIARYLDLIG